MWLPSQQPSRKNTEDISFGSLHFFLLVQVQFSHVTTCHSPAMSRRPAATTAAAAGGAGSSPVALPRSVAAARSSAHLQAARGSPHVRRKFAVNSTLNGGNNNVSDYQVERCCFVFFAKWFSIHVLFQCSFLIVFASCFSHVFWNDYLQRALSTFFYSFLVFIKIYFLNDKVRR